MIIRVTHDFEDLKHKRAKRRVGEVYNVSDERGKEIIKKGYAEEIKIIELADEPEEKPANEPEEKPAKRTKKSE